MLKACAELKFGPQKIGVSAIASDVDSTTGILP